MVEKSVDLGTKEGLTVVGECRLIASISSTSKIPASSRSGRHVRAIEVILHSCNKILTAIDKFTEISGLNLLGYPD